MCKPRVRLTGNACIPDGYNESVPAMTGGRITDSQTHDQAPSHDVRFARPVPALAECLAGYHSYDVRLPPGTVGEEIFFPAWANIRFQLTGKRWAMRYGEKRIDPIPHISLFGPTSCAGFAEFSGGHMFGVAITPVGWARLIGGDASRLIDEIVPLETVIGAEAAMLAERIAAVREDFDAMVDILQSWLLDRLARSRPMPELARIMDLLNSPAIESVEQAAERVDMPAWQFTRLCRRNFGFAPKKLMRRARFLRTLMILREASPLPWTERIEESYHDQSHFIRDCHDFLGMTPSQFLARAQPVAKTSMAERTRVLGAPAQALHRISGDRTG
jgi:AraC-like DNA-binding protein